MPKYLALVIFLTMVALVIFRVGGLKKIGIKAMRFGELDKTDFIIPPVMLIYFYHIFAGAFNWPAWGKVMFSSSFTRWIGVCFGSLAVVFMVLSLLAFGRSFRVGIDWETPDKLVTDSIFAFSRNPIYVGFLFLLLGMFLIFATPLFLGYLLGGVLLISRQIKREEEFLIGHYGLEYQNYMAKVKRYI